MAVKWLDESEPHHYDAASDYLTMLAEPVRVQKTVAVLRDATTRVPQCEEHPEGGPIGASAAEQSHSMPFGVMAIASA